MRLSVFGLWLIVPLMMGCQDVYHPIKNGVGFTEVPVGTDGYQVSYIGDSSMSVTEARRFAMLRASEIAVLHGKAYFQIKEEHIFVTSGTHYWPPTDSQYVEAVQGRDGRTRAFIHHSYDPGYVEEYTIPDVEMQVTLNDDAAAPSIPASYLLNQALTEKIKLSPGVAERVSAMPAASGTVTLPPEPAPATRPSVPGQ